jgi:GT2 family glycosyltransferase
LASPQQTSPPVQIWRKQSASADVSQSTADSVTVVICAHRDSRWQSLLRTVRSLRVQCRLPEQCIVVIDHNDQLLRRAQVSLPDDVEVLASEERRGLSGARNTGVRASRSDIVAFLDDDAEADPGWVGGLLAQYSDPLVVGAGSQVVAVWPRNRPAWLPTEFDWVVGCSYPGLPQTVRPVHKLTGPAISFRRLLFDQLGTFDTEMGQLGDLPLGREESEFALRIRRSLSRAKLVHVPTAIVRHHLGPERVRIAYYVRRCYSEGTSRAVLNRRAGGGASRAISWEYVPSTLSSGVWHGLRDGFQGDTTGFARSAMILVGLLAMTGGYLAGLGSSRSGSHPPPQLVLAASGGRSR